MSIPEKLNQQRLKEILLNIYQKGQESENIKVTDLIEEIKEQVLIIK